MKKMIRLRDITEARDFVALTSQFSERMELCDGETTVDATSIVGVFCLDHSRPVSLEIEADEKRGQEICRALSHFIQG